ncbi:MAG TPA: hypothetical protein VGZ22_09000, partial [Isosphaeraceae bacterium]|nr:hypothetical protein [Isosphaeraceae bacterium]
MRLRTCFAVTALTGLALVVMPARGADPSAGLKKGTPDVKSAGSLAFGPDGILFIGDSQGAAIFAIDTGDRTPGASGAELKVEGIDGKIAAMLGASPKEVTINDLAVNPISGKAYLSVSRGRGPSASPVIMRVDRAGKIEEVSLANVGYAKAELPNAPSETAAGAPQPKGGSPRAQSITDLAYVDGRVFVAGLSNEEFSSRLLSIPYPFTSSAEGASIEIYHGSHGRFETKSPVRTFVAYRISGDPYLMAAYTCTPLVKIPVSALKSGSHVKGTTIAELGNHNVPLDMIVYQKDGKNYLLVANNSRGVMKVSTDGADKAEPITKPV